MWNNPCRGIHQCGRADLSVSRPKSRHDYTFPPAHRVAWLSPHSLPLGRGWWIKLATDVLSQRTANKSSYYTNCAPKVRECTWLESPLTLTLSPLDKGGEGREWGDSERSGICEL